MEPHNTGAYLRIVSLKMSICRRSHDVAEASCISRETDLSYLAHKSWKGSRSILRSKRSQKFHGRWNIRKLPNSVQMLEQIWLKYQLSLDSSMLKNMNFLLAYNKRNSM